jgi:hypothetical protein
MLPAFLVTLARRKIEILKNPFLRRQINDLRPRLPYLEESELYTILQQGGVLPALHVALGKNSPMQVLKDLKDIQGRGLEWRSRSTSTFINHSFLAPLGLLSFFRPSL